MWTSNQYDGNSTGTRKRSIRTDPDLIFIGQCEATLVWGPETGADCNCQIPDSRSLGSEVQLYVTGAEIGNVWKFAPSGTVEDRRGFVAGGSCVKFEHGGTEIRSTGYSASVQD